MRRKNAKRKVDDEANGEEVEVEDEDVDNGDDDTNDEEPEEEYEVEDIIDHKKEKGHMMYKIRWKNYGKEHDTWEPASTLSCPDIIKKYKSKIGDKKGAKKAKKEDEEEREPADPNKEYEVERIVDVHFKKNGKRDFLVHWKGYGVGDETWEPEENLNCRDLIDKFDSKLSKVKNLTEKELRICRKQTNRLQLMTHEKGRKLSKRNTKRVNYRETE